MALLEILKPGTYTDMKGTKVTFSEADLRQVVESYDPAKHEAPLVLGHPKHDDPAHGWVGALQFSDGALRAEPKDVTPELKALVASKQFKHLSASLYSPQAPGNPTTGKWYLRHLGFLGAFPPAVKGLAPITLAADEQGVHEFAEEDADLWSRLRDWFIGKFGQEEADNVLPKWRIDAMASNCCGACGVTCCGKCGESCDGACCEDCKAKPSMSMTNFSEREDTVNAEHLAAKETALTAKEADLTRRETALAEKEAAALKAEAVAFADGLVAAGKVLPKDKALIVALLLPGTATVELGEGQEPAPVASCLKTFLGALPKVIELGETATGGVPTGSVEFAAPPGMTVDPGRLEIHHKALAHQRANPTTTYEAAVAAVSQELTR